ncbi:MAG: response regulator transcription factor [Ignavibacteriales bacterium]|nr:response regulator transcription factor [Ignavibacteriales bacterium]
MATILLIEDEESMATGLRDAFEHHGYRVMVAAEGEAGLNMADEELPDIILLDVMLPGIDGFDVCRLLRKRGVTVPILMLTARGEEVDKVVGMAIGADDYLTKPFSTRELLARVKVHLRRVTDKVPSLGKYEFGDVKVDFTKFKAYKNSEPVDLTSTEFSLLQLLITRRSEIVTREQILNTVWGYDTYPDSRTVDTHILNLRQKLEDNPRKPEYILTVHGLGYKFAG